MSVDRLQDKIRKTKNPSVVVFEAVPEWIPGGILEAAGSVAKACEEYFGMLLEGLKGLIPAVRFGFGSFALLGAVGMDALYACIDRAKELGYYVLLDLPEILSPAAAQSAVSAASGYHCDGFVVGSYLGSDILQAVKPLCKEGKAVFAVVRTSNRSAGELQDLMTGGRLVHTAAADLVSRHGESSVGKCGYSHLGALAAAASADSLRTLRTKYSRVFLLLDGFDYPNANAKNCSFAFDRFGHGAAACASASILAAWKDAEGEDPVAPAVAAAERMKKNLTRYISVL